MQDRSEVQLRCSSCHKILFCTDNGISIEFEQPKIWECVSCAKTYSVCESCKRVALDRCLECYEAVNRLHKLVYEIKRAIANGAF